MSHCYTLLSPIETHNLEWLIFVRRLFLGMFRGIQMLFSLWYWNSNILVVVFIYFLFFGTRTQSRRKRNHRQISFASHKMHFAFKLLSIKSICCWFLHWKQRIFRAEGSITSEIKIEQRESNQSNAGQVRLGLWRVAFPFDFYFGFSREWNRSDGLDAAKESGLAQYMIKGQIHETWVGAHMRP